MKWFNGLDSSTRALIVTLINVLVSALITALSGGTPAPAQVNVTTPPGIPMVAAPAPK